MGIEKVVGTQASDRILGNDRSNQLYGASFATSAPSNPVARTQPTQWVLLDFVSATDIGEYNYTPADRATVIQGLEAVYYGYDANGLPRTANDPNRWFNVRFTQNVNDIPLGTQYVTITFNQTPATGNPGGESSEIDFGNTNLGGSAVVQVHGLLGGTALAPKTTISESSISSDFLADMFEDGEQTFGQRNPDNTAENFVALSTKIAAHELGHLLGLRHYDSFGPVGTGIHSPPGASAFKPEYTGPSEAFETFNHLISSPASVGSDRKNDIGSLFFGEREAVKLAFAASDATQTRVTETVGLHQTLDQRPAAQLVHDPSAQHAGSRCECQQSLLRRNAVGQWRDQVRRLRQERERLLLVQWQEGRPGND